MREEWLNAWRKALTITKEEEREWYETINQSQIGSCFDMCGTVDETSAVISGKNSNMHDSGDDDEQI